MRAPVERRGLPVEAVAVWGLYALVSMEIVVTYSRLPATELYHVTSSGIEGGASRVLVFLNFPVALAAVAILALIFDSLEGLFPRMLAVVAAALSLVVVWPGVVSQANLDAKPVNTVPALGVLLAFVLTLAVARRGLTSRGWEGADWGRVVLAAVLVFAALPWLAAELGFFLDAVPGIGNLFQTGHVAASVRPPAVHHGHHHGVDGLLLVLTALLLSRRLDVVRTRGLRLALSAYLALMLCYGVANMANDFWDEQLVKRGLTHWRIPSVLAPHASAAWGLIVLAAAVVWLVSRRARRNMVCAAGDTPRGPSRRPRSRP